MDSARHVIGCRLTQETRVCNAFDDVVGTLMDSARYVIGFRLTQETRVQKAFDDVASTIHQSLMVSARYVLGCRLTQETRVCNAFNDVASTIHRFLPHHAPGDAAHGHEDEHGRSGEPLVARQVVLHVHAVRTLRLGPDGEFRGGGVFIKRWYRGLMIEANR